MNWYLEVLKKYVEFTGRARRTEFWMFALINLIVSLVLAFLLGRVLGGVIPALYSLAVFLPSLGVAVRRLHDTGRTGWWLLIGLVPVIGFIVLLVFMVLDSDAGENQYGASPK